MNKSTVKAGFSAVFFWIITLMPPALQAQETDTASQAADPAANYQEQIKRLVGFLEFSLNTLGDPETSTKEKEVIINESYLKAFLNDKVQIEDDLDENREMVTHKDVQAYLKDVDFFFEQVEISFDVQDIQRLMNDEGMVYFKVTANRQLKGLTVENEPVNNTRVRYIEINLDEEEQVLKIASIYTTRINEKQELMAWWNNLSSAWKSILGNKQFVIEGVAMDGVEFLDDSTLCVARRLPGIIQVDTTIEILGKTTHIVGADTVFQIEFDTIPAKGTMAIKLLLEMPRLESLDVSGNLDVYDLSPVDQLSGLKKLNVSSTMTDNLFPVRNLARLETLDISGTAVKDLSPVKYNIKICELNLSNTAVSSIRSLENLQSLETLYLNDTRVDSLQALTVLPEMKDLRIKNCPVADLTPLAQLTRLEILDISGTQIASLEPVRHVVSLKVIYLENTVISDLEPLGKLDNLQVIDLDNTPVSNLDPLKGLSSLEKIYCDRSGVQKSSANAFMLSKPGTLVIYESETLNKWWAELSFDWKTYFRKDNPLDDPPTIEQLHALTLTDTVDISGLSSITDLGPLSKLTNLKEVNCQGNPVSDLSPVGELIDLSLLNCSGTRVKDLTHLRGLVRLKELNISETFVSSLDGLEKVTGLEVLIMDNTPVDNLDSVAGNPNLRIIYCDETKIGKLDIDGFLKTNPECLIIFQTPQLQSWWQGLPIAWQDAFRENTTLDDPPTREQLHLLTGLTEVNLNDNKSISDLQPILMFSRIEKLNLTNDMVSDIQPLSTLITLSDLNLSGNPLADIAPLSAMIALRHLDISNTAVVKLDPLEMLQNLEYLNCSGTPVKKLDPIELLFQLRRLDINNTSIKSLKPLDGMVALRQLNCFNTSISPKNIEKFKGANPQVEVIYY